MDNKKTTALKKSEAKRLFLSLSVLSLVAVAISMGEKLNKDRRPLYILAGTNDRMEKLNRAIASAQPFDLVEDVTWEHGLVSKLDHLDRKPAAIGEKPSAVDQLRFGQLAGKYRINQEATRIREIEYVDSSDVSDRPVLLRDRSFFLAENRSLLSVPFEEAKLDLKSSTSEVYRLFDKRGKIVGRAAFEFDDGGHFLSLKIQGD